MKSIIKHPVKFGLAALLLAASLSACKRNQVVPVPDFDATLDGTSYAVNAPITFNFTGDADIITFYSGAAGSEYKNRDRLTVTGKPQMQFNSAYTNGPEGNTLHVMISKDFSNVFAVPDVQLATWKDITARAKLATTGTSTASGTIDLSDIVSGDDPVNIAFKYSAKDTTTARPTWSVTGISISNLQADNTSVAIATNANINWGAVTVLGTQPWSFNTTSISITGTAKGTPDNESWCITQSLQLDRVTRDMGIPVKTNATTKQKSFVFAGYAKAGTYLVTFEAINASAWGKQVTTREFTITVQ